MNIGLIFLILLGFEVGLHLFAKDEHAGRMSGSYRQCVKLGDRFLGHTLVPNSAGVSTKHVGEEQIYSVTYGVGPDGLRVTPEPADSAQASILFFGCSMTFGSGLEDEDTLPYRVGVRARGLYATHNFALHGYGPHQMLSALEHGFVRDRVVLPPRYAIYSGAPFHVRRVGGVWWDPHGPRYLLGSDGGVEFRGRFSENAGRVQKIWSRLRPRLQSSSLCRELMDRIRFERRENHDLFMAILDASRRRIESEYPGCEFHVIFWDDYGGEIHTDLETVGIRVHRMTKIIPGIADESLKYRLHKYDLHPNAETNDLIAKYVVASILDGDTSEESTPPASSHGSSQ
jgi:hypothetical protein